MDTQIEQALADFSNGSISRLELLGKIFVFVNEHPDQYRTMIDNLRNSNDEDLVYIAVNIDRMEIARAIR